MRGRVAKVGIPKAKLAYDRSFLRKEACENRAIK